MSNFVIRAAGAVCDAIFPRAPTISKANREKLNQSSEIEKSKIQEMTRSGASDALLAAARRVLDEEEGRKSSAEARATALLAAVATLVPLLTWAIGATTPACSPGWSCGVWALAFIAAVSYLLLAGFWSLKTLSVANYEVIGAEDIRKLSYDRDPELAMAKQALTSARYNQNTINRKLDCLMAAQRAFYLSFFLLGVLLISDPLMRLQFFASALKPLHTSVSAAPSHVYPLVLTPQPPTASVITPLLAPDISASSPLTARQNSLDPGGSTAAPSTVP